MRNAMAVFSLGAVLMLAFEHWITLAAGVALLFAGIALAAFAIASPEFLDGEDAER